jgi:hypothetical protein
MITHNELPGRPMISKRGRKTILERSSVIRDWLSSYLSRVAGGRLDPGKLSGEMSEQLVDESERLEVEHARKLAEMEAEREAAELAGQVTDDLGTAIAELERNHRTLPTSVTAGTVRRWLRTIGFQRKMVSRGVYHDGHERADVVAYRNDAYLPQMKILELRMGIWDEDSQRVWFKRPPTLLPGQKEIIAIFHDETALHAQEMPRYVWVWEAEQVLRQKSDGKLFMISDFIMKEGEGRLVLPEHFRSSTDTKEDWDARRKIEPGKNS